MLLRSRTALPAGFNRLAGSNLAAQSAEQVGLAAAPIVAVLALGAGAGETGLLQTGQTRPFLLLSIPAGVLADRMSRRRLMTSAEALRAVSLVGILALTPLGLLTLPLLALLGFAGACGTVAYSWLTSRRIASTMATMTTPQNTSIMSPIPSPHTPHRGCIPQPPRNRALRGGRGRR